MAMRMDPYRCLPERLEEAMANVLIFSAINPCLVGKLDATYLIGAILARQTEKASPPFSDGDKVRVKDGLDEVKPLNNPSPILRSGGGPYQVYRVFFTPSVEGLWSVAFLVSFGHGKGEILFPADRFELTI